jgi:hypothetical protein
LCSLQNPFCTSRSLGYSYQPNNAKEGSRNNAGGHLQNRYQTEYNSNYTVRPGDEGEYLDESSIHTGAMQRTRTGSKDFIDKGDDAVGPSTHLQTSKSFFARWLLLLLRIILTIRNKHARTTVRCARNFVTEHRPLERVESELTFEIESFSNRETTYLLS